MSADRWFGSCEVARITKPTLRLHAIDITQFGLSCFWRVSGRGRLSRQAVEAAGTPKSIARKSGEHRNSPDAGFFHAANVPWEDC